MSAGGPCSRRDALGRIILGASGLALSRCAPAARPDAPPAGYDQHEHYWGYAIDTRRCIGCNACMRACRAENAIPRQFFRTWVERYRIDAAGRVSVDVAARGEHVFAPIGTAVEKAFFVPKLCNHCEKSVCTQVCPVGASYHTADGVVLVDETRCIGCGYCVQACPYGCRFINPIKHVADKCTLCYHRITRGLQPACVLACPRKVRLFGDLKDPRSSLRTILKQRRYQLLRPHLGTHPKCYYIGLDLKVV